jgi:hypothetical protein
MSAAFEVLDGWFFIAGQYDCVEMVTRAEYRNTYDRAAQSLSLCQHLEVMAHEGSGRTPEEAHPFVVISS